MQNFRALGAPPQTPMPPVAWGFAPKTAPPLRISGYAPASGILHKWGMYGVVSTSAGHRMFSF